jgi:transposase
MVRPSKEELTEHPCRQEASQYFQVTERTIIRWLKHYNLYTPTENYGCNKLNMEIAREIRHSYKAGMTMKELAKKYEVTISTISRIIHKINYPENTEVATVNVIYNPRSGSR